jgi:hypothetical protein
VSRLDDLASAARAEVAKTEAMVAAGKSTGWKMPADRYLRHMRAKAELLERAAHAQRVVDGWDEDPSLMLTDDAPGLMSTP